MKYALTTDFWQVQAEKAQRDAAEWRQNFDVLQRALVGDTGASGITVAAALRKDSKRYRAFRELVKTDPVRAQALVWEARPSRKRFDELVDASRS